MPCISIIVPIYRVENYIHRCIDSILAQTYGNFDLVLVDDGSPDRCGRICEEYAEKDSRIHVIHRKNGGLSAARNTGIEWALENSDSRYLTFIDSDDWIHPQFLEILLHALVDTGVSMVGRCYTDTYSLNYPVYERIPEPVLLKPEELFLSREWDFNYAWGKLYPKDAFRTLRYPEGKNFEDVFTTYQVLFAQSQIALVDEPLYYYFHNPSGISHSPWNPGELVILEGMRKQMAFYLGKGFDRAFEKEEKLYVNHHAYQLVRIRENRTDWQKNKPYWKQLRKDMLRLLKENSDKYNHKTMPQCFAAAWPVRTRLKKFVSNVVRVWQNDGIKGTLERIRNRMGEKNEHS